MTEQILSRTRLKATVERYHLYQDHGGLNKLMPASDPVASMRKDIKIEPISSTDHPDQLTAFKIDYTAASPELAQQINGELTSMFIEEDLRAQRELSKSTTAFLESQLADAKAKLEDQERKVRAFKMQHFGDLPSQAETNVQILSGLQSQLLSTQRELDAAKQQRLYLESLRQEYEAARVNSGSDPSAPSLPELTKQLMNLRLALADARVRLTDDHPDIVALKDKIAKTEKLKQDLEAENAERAESLKKDKGNDPSSSADVRNGAPTPMMQVQSQLKAVNLEIQSHERQVNELEAQVSSYRTRLNVTPQTEQELVDMSRGYEESKANYNSLLQKQNQSELATSLQEHQKGQQFRLLDPPSLPLKPSAPNRLMVSFGGLAASTILGVGLAALLEIMNAVVRKEQDLEGIIPAVVLVGIPHLPLSGEDKHKVLFRWLEIGAVSVMGLLILLGNFYTFRKG
jgi:polysaccharide chain length determinant protein (PEP-CTERM system associated)